jgi:hypothetical protein
MQTISIQVSDKYDLQLILLLVKRLGLKIIEQPAIEIKKNEDIEYHRNVIKNSGLMTEERMQDMLNWLEEDRKNDSRSTRIL